MTRTLTVYSEPVAKARPRAVRRGAGVGMYTPAKTAREEWEIRQAWLGQHGCSPLEGPVSLRVRAYLKRPQSIPKKHRLTARPVRRPDIDNYAKTVLDALNGIAFMDDAQVVALFVQKLYAVESAPRWEISVAGAAP